MIPFDPQRWLAAIVESSDDAIVGKKLNGTIVSWNRGAERIFGYTAREIVGQNVRKLFPRELRSEEDTIVARLSKGERVEHYETVRLRKDGKRIDVSLSVSPILNDQGGIEGAAKIARDITEAKQMRENLRLFSEQLQEQATELEQQLEETTTMGVELETANQELSEALLAAHHANQDAERAREEAVRASQAKSEFLAMMSHELRTPLNAISGYVDLMDAGVSGELPTEYRSYIDRIRKSQRHLLDLISHVLDLSRLEAGRLKVHVEPIPVWILFERLEEMVAPQIASNGHKLELRRPSDSLRVKVDQERALQILLNLVGNSIKFTPQGGRIAVSAKDDRDSTVSISVTDTGRGVAKQDRERIFEPFVQSDPLLTRTQQGAGLGLAISRQLARAMSGDLTLDDTSDRGTTFTLHLQRADEPSKH